MSVKKFKSVSVLFLSIVYLVASCLVSFTFADVPDAYENVTPGKYYIKNKDSGLFLGGLDFYSIVNSTLDSSSDLQKWELEYASNGYYRLKNVYSGYYLTASSIVFPGESVNESSLETSGIFADAQLWKFNDLESGRGQEYREYNITSKSSENSEWDLALVGDTVLTNYGYQVIQDEYGLDNDFSDEWILIPIRDAYIVGITNTSTFHNHTSVLASVEEHLLNDFYDVTKLATSSTTAYTIKTYMQKSDFFILRGDGMYDSIGTKMYLNSSGSNYIHSWDIYNYNSDSGIDLSNCNLVFFAGCYTANHSTQSLPQAAVDAGALSALGFTGNIECDNVAIWTERFTYYYTNGDMLENEHVENAALDAAIDLSVYSSFAFDYLVCG